MLPYHPSLLATRKNEPKSTSTANDKEQQGFEPVPQIRSTHWPVRGAGIDWIPATPAAGRSGSSEPSASETGELHAQGGEEGVGGRNAT
mgnify:CR=1 FL=1